jgi:hypothetical protein
VVVENEQKMAFSGEEQVVRLVVEAAQPAASGEMDRLFGRLSELSNRLDLVIVALDRNTKELRRLREELADKVIKNGTFADK